MNKSNCAGCRDNFYNGNNNLGVKECWRLKTAKLKTKYAIDRWTSTFQENFVKVRVPNCYHQSGRVYVDSISRYPKVEK